MNLPRLSFPHPLRRKDDPPKHRFRKGIYIVPSLFTAANIFLGFYALMQAMQGTAAEAWRFDHAAKAIGFAVLFDSLDGFIARMTKTSSDFGRELDSLADVITFGVAPSFLAFLWGFHVLPPMSYPDWRANLVQIGFIFCFVFLIAGACRLARFNIQVNPQPSNPGRPDRRYFVGMPIPAAAGLLASVIHLNRGRPLTTWWMATIWLGLIIASSYLMVSTWRFFSTKGLKLNTQHPARLLMFIAALMSGIWYFSRWVLFALAMLYMGAGILWRLQWIFRRRPRPSPPAPLQEASQTS
jgi:CDP-diacylglycerol--serine O-phosphatidyltransferase